MREQENCYLDYNKITATKTSYFVGNLSNILHKSNLRQNLQFPGKELVRKSFTNRVHQINEKNRKIEIPTLDGNILVFKELLECV